MEKTSDIGLPWSSEEGDIRDCTGDRFAEVFGCHDIPTDHVRAAYIVKTVNNHDVLVALVGRLVKCVGTDGPSRATALDARDLLASLE